MGGGARREKGADQATEEHQHQQVDGSVGALSNQGEQGAKPALLCFGPSDELSAGKLYQAVDKPKSPDGAGQVGAQLRAR